MEMYAKRLHNPFSGVLQVVATEHIRAISMDGIGWELQLRCDLHRLKPGLSDYLPRIQYARIGSWHTQNGFKPYPLDPAIKRDEVEAHYPLVTAALANIKIPLPQDDVYEQWLLEERTNQPLALLASCRHAAEIPEITTAPVAWKALNASQLPIAYTDEENRRGMPPVNYRMEMLVKDRAGQNPHARWYYRQADASGIAVKDSAVLPAAAFPELLVQDTWKNPSEQGLCDRYLQRLAPQLLILQRLSHHKRDWVEQVASRYVVEMDRCFHLYPTVADHARMTAWRVEARLRVACDKT